MKILTYEEITQISLKVFAINMQRLMKKQNTTLTELSIDTNINKRYLEKIVNGEIMDIKIEKLFLIAKSLKTELFKMFMI